MLPYFKEKFGNAASRNHRFGWEAEEAVEKARAQVAAVLGASAKEIVWTSGATESNNIAVKGAARMYREKGRHIITQVTEHKAVLDPCKYLEQEGFRVTYLPVNRNGRIDLEQLRAAMTDDTILVSIMYANNEIGTLQPIAEIGKLCKERGVLFHTDATQAFGKVPIDVEAMGIDLLSLSAHKIYGPKGVGALYVRRKNPRVRCEPVLHGGGHERGMRSGTLNTPGIVGLGAAAEIAAAEMDSEGRRIAGLRDRLWNGLTEKLDEIYRNGDPEHCVPGTLNVSFAYVEGESLMMGFENIAVSSGSACTSASLERRRGAGPQFHPLQPRAVHHLRGNRADHQAGDRRRAAPAGHEPAVRDGEGRHRSEDGGLVTALNSIEESFESQGIKLLLVPAEAPL